MKLRDKNGKAKLTFSILLLVLFCASCKKDESSADNTEPVVSPLTGSRTELTLDSIFLYARQIYLWNHALPSYDVFNPRTRYGIFANELEAFKTELFDISQMPTDPAAGHPYETPYSAGTPKYSYLEKGTLAPGNSVAGMNTGQAAFHASLIRAGENKIAYLAFGSFPRLSSCKAELDAIFSRFAEASPHDMIIDLRNNSGGFIETAEYMANLLSPPSLDGKIMFTEEFNSQMQNGKAAILRHQPYLDENGKPVIYKGRYATLADVDYTEAGNTFRFSKKGNLESLTDLYFITSPSTASASEMLISCMKPYLPVTIVGEKTYGKPVGFFGVNIDHYSVWFSGFLIKNASGWSGYFSGMNPDLYVKGDSEPASGDPDEICLKAALAMINRKAGSRSFKKEQVAVIKTFSQISVPSVKMSTAGMISTRLKLK